LDVLCFRETYFRTDYTLFVGGGYGTAARLLVMHTNRLIDVGFVPTRPDVGSSLSAACSVIVARVSRDL
jgi:hypothetical protein